MIRTLILVIVALTANETFGNAQVPLVFNCGPQNDLFNAVTLSGKPCPRWPDTIQAIQEAPRGATVMILADGYPEQATQLSREALAQAEEKQLRLYVEYPSSLPGLELGPPRNTQWERTVVATDAFGSALPRLRILGLHDCHFTPTSTENPLLVVARVAGYDTAVFGLPDKTSPILFEDPQRRLTIATTCLSRFVSARYAPFDDWRTLWTLLLQRLCPQATTLALQCKPRVAPAYARDETLPDDVERQVFRASVRWTRESRLLIHPSQERAIHKMLSDGVWKQSVPPAEAPVGDGSCGILEGYSSAIRHDGSQWQLTVIRADCNTESAMCLAFDAAVNQDAHSRKIAENLLNYVYFTSDLHGGVRGDPHHPAFGLIAWGAISPLWTRANYGDDDARVILSTLAAAACLKSDRWDERVLRALLANLRTTGKLGFRGSRIDNPDLERNGWKHYHDAETIFHSPHYESYLWACYLWAYQHTRHAEFRDKTVNAIRMTMDAYPQGWLWRNHVERAHMMLCLAWLIRVDDTPEHRAWLNRVTDDLLASQDACGAIGEIPGIGQAGYAIPRSNEAYGTSETPLVQGEDDPASDQLYTTGFAVLALHEAHAATGEPRFKQAEDKLMDYLCRIQARCRDLPYVNGGWFRAFDFRRWDYWASSADEGWGAWCLEAGWGEAWITATLALRAMNTTLWDLTTKTSIAKHMDSVQKLMAVNDGSPWQSTSQPATSPP